MSGLGGRRLFGRRSGGFGGWRPAAREARTGWPVLLVLAVLSAVLTVATLLWPPVFDRLATKELARRLDAAQVNGPLLVSRTSLNAPVNDKGQLQVPQFGTLDTDLTKIGEKMRQGTSGELGRAMARVSGWAESDGMQMSGDGVPQPHGNPGMMALAYAQDAADRVRWVAGRAPGLPADPATAPIELGLSAATLEQFGLKVGQHVFLAGDSRATETVVVGEFEPLDAMDDLWRELPQLNSPMDVHIKDSVYIRYGQAMVAPAGLEAIEARGARTLDATWVFWTAEQPWGTGGTFAGARELTDQARQFASTAATSLCGAVVSEVFPCIVGTRTVKPPRVNEQLSSLVDAFAVQRARTVVLQSFALAGLLAIGVSTAVAAARLGARRREGALALQRARGAGEPALAAVRLLEAVPAALAGLSAGWAVALRWSDGRELGAWWPALLAAALVALAPAVAVWWQGRAVRRAGREPVRRRGLKRALGLSARLVVEGAVLLLAAAGVLQLRLRGAAPAGSETDPQLALVPVVLGLAAVVLVLRLYPVPLRLVTAWARRRRGAVALVGLAQAGRRSGAAATALLVLVPALACAVFGALVSGTVREGRAEAARWRTGGDAVVLGPSQRALPLDELGRVPGVAGVLSVRGALAALTSDEDGTKVKGVGLVGVDPVALARYEPGSALAAALSGSPELTAPLGSGAELPALADKVTADRFPDGSFDADAGSTRVRVRIVGVLPDGAAADRAIGPVVEGVGTAGGLLVFGGPGAERLPRQSGQRSAAVLFAEPGRPGSAAGAGRIDAERLRSVVVGSSAAAGAGGGGAAGGAISRGAPVEIRSLDRQLRESAGDGLVSALETAFRAAAAIGLVLGLVAVVLELLLSSAERGRTLAHLRTLGLGSRAAAGVQLVQLLPVMVAAVLGGTLLGLALPWLIGPALELRAFTGGPGVPPFAPDWAAVAVAALGLLVLIPCAAALEGVTGRRRVPQVLRLGEGV
ncbi:MULTISPECIES: FtsX-like permease family protein [Kitasatospora]|uniref:ABC3 transporter permease C-terminal domain-containing protein n=1 Tax=Kitasatospora setae (strain ATCC 33774 / DSM 43861 / JCM 3304 / KCC A-0304 / NBRC 14216 / KM-6054) TaxID=452652 RepID=E4NI87_KITSK|nr:MULTISPECIES: FtsX-like permease family protein [Kitasatospora]BAJ31217.1 hypothetical protein KSE_54420 [Kitasatospora setae KM-6054]